MLQKNCALPPSISSWAERTIRALFSARRANAAEYVFVLCKTRGSWARCTLLQRLLSTEVREELGNHVLRGQQQLYGFAGRVVKSLLALHKIYSAHVFKVVSYVPLTVTEWGKPKGTYGRSGCGTESGGWNPFPEHFNAFWPRVQKIFKNSGKSRDF